MASQQFTTQLTKFKINLDQDAIEYIGGMLDDMTLTDHDEVRESTETFLMDANINDKTRNDFYASLFSSNVFQGKEAAVVDNGPVALEKKVLKKTAVENSKVIYKKKKSFLCQIRF